MKIEIFNGKVCTDPQQYARFLAESSIWGSILNTLRELEKHKYAVIASCKVIYWGKSQFFVVWPMGLSSYDNSDAYESICATRVKIRAHSLTLPYPAPQETVK